MAKTRLKATTIAKRIDTGQYDGGQLDKESQYARDIVAALEGLGWKYAPHWSTCSVASFEAHMGKGYQRIEITAAYWCGPFVEIRVWDADDTIEESRKAHPQYV
jgi:hypothetical protein